jgi:8-oxo-dGTP pyrophosphatase MutT (NUDIX family)
MNDPVRSRPGGSHHAGAGDAARRGERTPVVMQVSAGGVAFRRDDGRVEVALISVGTRRRWQLPKGHVDEGENPEQAAVREVREEAGVDTEVMEPLGKVEYWFVATDNARRVRFHKFVHFFLLAYRAGDVADHDHEVHEARWVPIDEALHRLAFDNEREVMARARVRIAELTEE